MQSAYRIGATLETIPTELKLEIASHLDPGIPNDLRWSKAAQHDAESTALQSVRFLSCHAAGQRLSQARGGRYAKRPAPPHRVGRLSPSGSN